MSEEDQITTPQIKYLNILTKDLTDEVVAQHIQKPIEDLTKQEASNIIEGLKELPENAPLSKAKVGNLPSGTPIEIVKDDVPVTLDNETHEYYVGCLNAASSIVKASNMTYADSQAKATLIIGVFNKIAKDKYYLDKGE